MSMAGKHQRWAKRDIHLSGGHTFMNPTGETSHQILSDRDQKKKKKKKKSTLTSTASTDRTLSHHSPAQAFWKMNDLLPRTTALAPCLPCRDDHMSYLDKPRTIHIRKKRLA